MLIFNKFCCFFVKIKYFKIILKKWLKTVDGRQFSLYNTGEIRESLILQLNILLLLINKKYQGENKKEVAMKKFFENCGKKFVQADVAYMFVVEELKKVC